MAHLVVSAQLNILIKIRRDESRGIEASRRYNFPFSATFGWKLAINFSRSQTRLLNIMLRF